MLENFIYSKRKSLFEKALNNGEILDEAIVFIEDTKEIWNHGTYFDGSTVDLSNIEESIKSYLPLSGGTLTSSDVPLTINRTGNVNSGIRFQKDGVEYGSIGFYDGLGLSYYDATDIGWYKIWNENNFNPNNYLSLGGGTVSNSGAEFFAINRTDGEYSVINFLVNNEWKGRLGFKSDHTPVVMWQNEYHSIYHSGKAGSGSGIDADMLDGKHDGELTAAKLSTPRKIWGNSFDGSGDVNDNLLLPNYKAIQGMHTDGTTVSNMLHMGNDDVVKIGGGDVPVCLYGNIGIGTTSPDYKLDVNGTFRVTGASELKNGISTTYGKFSEGVSADTLINIYDNSDHTNRLTMGWIDGTASLYSIADDKSAYNNLYIGNSTGTGLTFNANLNTWGLGTSTPQRMFVISRGGGEGIEFNPNYINYSLVTYNRSTSEFLPFTINSKSVGIGITEPQAKLDINGDLKIAGVFKCNTGGTYDNIRLFAHKDDEVVYLQAGNYTGNSVNGDLVISAINNNVLGSVTIKSNDVKISKNISVYDEITSGDYCDWYGVSWSENSSDPTCTRIGNMAMHRSLPIQSAMKGYVINSAQENTLLQESIAPIKSDWQTTEYNFLNNGQSNNAFTGDTSNIFIKIPEFWYIDEYDGATKTHNLKISQTAKAGWCHHKEAYVGAYEGYDDGVSYRSTKGVIPTVSATREQFRAKARANGQEGESKWNIYTYEEHRAICHLFLVEYATRNSQLDVNPALTAEGFKQGGLGSGCTTGTMDDAYSFIPTGTTDSLGNGSGQVAYTASNGTTYYANRYRGIENPFGHIWKLCDDIISIYDPATACRAVYKCEKPSAFATNKNNSYKGLCAFPGGLQGYKKEIKATINCDFFPMTVGGSATSYWCDYTYDDTDTSEHCLLIGGISVNGANAGPFYFTLHCRVDHSYVNAGSRLTYLPWVE